MKNKTKLKLLALFFLGLILLSSCKPAPQEETASVSEIETMVVVNVLASQTAIYEQSQTQNAALIQSETPTLTLTASPTFTQEPTLTLTPMFTSTPQFTATNIPPSATIQKAYSCVLIRQSPLNKTYLSPGEDFDMRWTVQNTGTETWEPEDVSWYLLNGYALHKYQDSYNLTESVKPLELTDILVDMTAPTDTGNYTAIWALQADDLDFCWFSIEILIN